MKATEATEGKKNKNSMLSVSSVAMRDSLTEKIVGAAIDILVAGKVVVELKSVSKLQDIFVAQTLSYLKSTRLKRALLINFGEKRLADGIKRISL